MEDGAHQQSGNNVELRTLVLECSNTVLTSLLGLTGSPGPSQMPDAFADKINTQYADLDSCDYIGALSYPSRLRLPKTYQQLVEENKNIQPQVLQPPSIRLNDDVFKEEEDQEGAGCKDDDDDNDSGTSITSGVTEGPEMERDRRELMESVDQDLQDDASSVMDRFESNANGVHCSHVDLEREAARQFLKDLQSFLPSLNAHRSPLEVDMAIQQFASDYCEGKLTIELLVCSQFSSISVEQNRGRPAWCTTRTAFT